MNIPNFITYIFLFTSLYFEVFMLITYLENRKKIKRESNEKLINPKKYPSVSIIVPAFNEENTISKTIHSLLNLDYPKNKLKIIAVDDGSKDRTYEVLKKFEKNPQIEILRKENGGKHTALNLALQKSDSELVGCLDADSYVDKNALKYIVLYFEKNKKAMAVTPSVKIHNPKNVLQMIQKVEYGWGVLLRKLLASLSAMYVTPGPFSIFKREVFDKIGPYRKAHNTEDMELAMRMQLNKMKIVNCHKAEVFTTGPNTIKKLLNQRLRWTYGFIQNSIDYRFMFFKKEYGNLGIFILPMAGLSIFSGIYILGNLVYTVLFKAYESIIKIQTVGIHFGIPDITFDIFSVNTEFLAIASLMTLFLTLTLLYISRRLSEGKFVINMELIYFMTLYTLIAPLWLARAVFRTIIRSRPNWR